MLAILRQKSLALYLAVNPMSHNNEQCRKICPREQKWQECYGVEQRFLIECKAHSTEKKKYMPGTVNLAHMFVA